MQIFWFDAPDLWGKTTQIKKIEEVLALKGYKVLVLRQPGFTSICNEIRELLLDPEKNIKEEMSYFTRRTLYFADYFQKLEIIAQAEKDGYDFVLCDRCQLISDAVYGFMMEPDKSKRVSKAIAAHHLLNVAQINKMLLRPTTWFHECLILGTITPPQLINRLNTKRYDKVTIYDEKNTEFKIQIAKSYSEIADIYHNIYTSEDTYYLKSILNSFSNVCIVDSNKEECEMTDQLLKLVLAGKERDTHDDFFKEIIK